MVWARNAKMLFSWLKLFKKKILHLREHSPTQWFSTGVPRDTRVPWDSARGAANNCNSLIFKLFCHLGVPPNIDIAEQGCRVAKKVEKHCSNCCKFSSPHFIQTSEEEFVAYLKKSFILKKGKLEFLFFVFSSF